MSALKVTVQLSKADVKNALIEFVLQRIQETDNSSVDNSSAYVYGDGSGRVTLKVTD